MIRVLSQVGEATADADSAEEEDMQTADPIVHGTAARADAAHPSGACTIWSLWRVLAAVCGLLAASALGARTLGRPCTVNVYTIAVGRLPDALVLDAGASRAFVADAAAGAVSALDLATRHVLRTVVVGQPGAFAPLALAVDTRASCLRGQQRRRHRQRPRRAHGRRAAANGGRLRRDARQHGDSAVCPRGR